MSTPPPWARTAIVAEVLDRLVRGGDADVHTLAEELVDLVRDGYAAAELAEARRRLIVHGNAGAGFPSASPDRRRRENRQPTRR